MNSVDKKTVKTRFKKSLPTYDNTATVQKHMCNVLMYELFNCKTNDFDTILEIGCGTGTLTKKVVKEIKYKKLFINDIVEDSLDELEKLSVKVKKLPGDCETIDFPQTLNLVISNATFQWIEDLELLSEKICSSLNIDGIIAFSTFQCGNLYQIKELTGKSLNYYKKSELETILNKKFNIITSYEETINLEFDSVIDILRHLKQSGVNSLENSIWTKSKLQKFEDDYARLFKQNDKLVLTYKPLYFIAEKF